MFPPETQRISGLLQQRRAYSDHQEGGEGGDLLSDQQSGHLQSNKQPTCKTWNRCQGQSLLLELMRAFKLLYMILIGHGGNIHEFHTQWIKISEDLYINMPGILFVFFYVTFNIVTVIIWIHMSLSFSTIEAAVGQLSAT